MELELFRSVAVLGSVALTAIVLELIRRRKLKEELWVPWLLVAIAPLVVGVWITPWAVLARWLGIFYEPALLFGLGIFLSISMILYLTVVISTLLSRSLRLAQDLALLEERVEALARRTEDRPGA